MKKIARSVILSSMMVGACAGPQKLDPAHQAERAMVAAAACGRKRGEFVSLQSQLAARLFTVGSDGQERPLKKPRCDEAEGFVDDLVRLNDQCLVAGCACGGGIYDPKLPNDLAAQLGEDIVRQLKKCNIKL